MVNIILIGRSSKCHGFSGGYSVVQGKRSIQYFCLESMFHRALEAMARNNLKYNEQFHEDFM